MAKLRTLFFGGLIVALPGLFQVSGAAPVASASSTPEPALEKDWAEVFAAREGITVSEARDAFADSRYIVDFIAKWSKDSRFGAVWVSYENGYQVHVRYITEDFRAEAEALARSVAGPIVMHTGGGSAPELAEIQAELERAEVPYEVDPMNGKIVVYRETTPETTLVLPSVTVLEGRPKLEPGSDEAHGGSDIWWYNGGWAVTLFAPHP